MSKQPADAAAVARVEDTPAYLELEARRRATAEELQRVEAELVEHRRRQDAGWQDAVAAAIAAGAPSPPRPAIANVADLEERARTLRLALGKIRQGLDLVVERESRERLAETAEDRSAMVRRMHSAMAELLASIDAYQGHRESLEATGVKTSLIEWLAIADPGVLRTHLADYERRAPAYLGVDF